MCSLGSRGDAPGLKAFCALVFSLSHSTENAGVFNKPLQRTSFGAGLYYYKEAPLGPEYREGRWNPLHHFYKRQMKCKLQPPLAPKPQSWAASVSQSCINKFSSVKPAEVLLTGPLRVLGGSPGPCDSAYSVCVAERQE